MIKASELRIGNYVDMIDRSQEIHLPVGIVKKIGQIGLFGVHLYEPKNFAEQTVPEGTPINEVTGIPLTEEWLIKFGFAIDLTKTEPSYKKWMMGYRCYIVDDKQGTRFEFWIEDRYCLVDIKYVHTLQNLYFALTGEELTIND
jgi:hypothetical protein|tara:strand:+ start:54 stop:485 length:432 start_codon:yes stop_codon:yes gene_type:complete